MRVILLVSLVLSSCFTGQRQAAGINLSEYLKPKCDTLYYNVVYNSFHASGLHDTIQVVYRKLPIGKDTAYYISSTYDPTGSWAQRASFSGSAMIFKNDSVLLASLIEDQDPTGLTGKSFDHVLPPGLQFSKPYGLAKLKWSFVTEVFIQDYQFVNLSLGDTVLKCLKLNLLVYDRSPKPGKSAVWLSRDYGTVKWVRETGRVEVLDLTRFKKNCP
jgi:hypothetical protein